MSALSFNLNFRLKSANEYLGFLRVLLKEDKIMNIRILFIITAVALIAAKACHAIDVKTMTALELESLRLEIFDPKIKFHAQQGDKSLLDGDVFLYSATYFTSPQIYNGQLCLYPTYQVQKYKSKAAYQYFQSEVFMQQRGYITDKKSEHCPIIKPENEIRFSKGVRPEKVLQLYSIVEYLELIHFNPKKSDLKFLGDWRAFNQFYNKNSVARLVSIEASSTQNTFKIIVNFDPTKESSSLIISLNKKEVMFDGWLI